MTKREVVRFPLKRDRRKKWDVNQSIQLDGEDKLWQPAGSRRRVSRYVLVCPFSNHYMISVRWKFLSAGAYKQDRVGCQITPEFRNFLHWVQQR